MKITVIDRPFLLTFHATGTTYRVTSDEVRNLLAEYPVIRATRNRLVLPGHNTTRASERVSIVPATRGGGPAFVITR